MKPLTAVSKICDVGEGKNQVTFTSTGGYIYHATTGKYTEFRREGGVYVLRTWIKRSPSVGASKPETFVRQGA